MVPPDAPFMGASDIGQGSGNNKVTCIGVGPPNATKVMMGNIGDRTSDEHVGRFKNELPHGTHRQEQKGAGLNNWMIAGPMEQMMDRPFFF